MKFIKPSVELKLQEAGEDGLFEHIEWAGRHCYKSHDKTTADSARRFVKAIVNRGHGSVLEHGTIYLSIPASEDISEFILNPYTRIVRCGESGDPKDWFAVTTNYRVIVENNWDLWLMWVSEPTPFHERRVSVKVTTDRGVTHEFVRHRAMSLAQESQRYCNYNKDKFGGQITYIKPSWWDVMAPEDKARFKAGLLMAEEAYLEAVKVWDERKPDKRFRTGFKGNPLSPQAARMILPNATKTELIMTGFVSDWEHFFKLRCSSAAHPDARHLAEKIKSLMIEQNLITEDNGN